MRLYSLYGRVSFCNECRFYAAGGFAVNHGLGIYTCTWAYDDNAAGHQGARQAQ